MAHNIEYNKAKGTHSFFSKKEMPWHNLGQIVEDAKTSSEVLKLANLDFEVITAPNHAKYGEEYIRNPLSFSTVRTDNKEVLGTVGNKYKVLQNTEAFNFFDDIVGSKEAIFETAGVLGEGQKIFITAKLPDYIIIDGGLSDDTIEQYLLLTNDHTGSESAQITFTPVRVVCNNTLNMALRGATNVYRIRHTKSIKSRLDEVARLMGLKNKYFNELAIGLNAMKAIKLSESNVKHLLCEIYLTTSEYELLAKNNGKLKGVDEISTKKKNTIIDAYSWIDQGIGQDSHRGTGLWLFNGMVGYYNNGRSYTNEQRRFENIMGGTANKIINQVASKVLTYD